MEMAYQAPPLAYQPQAFSFATTTPGPIYAFPSVGPPPPFHFAVPQSQGTPAPFAYPYYPGQPPAHPSHQAPQQQQPQFYVPSYQGHPVAYPGPTWPNPNSIPSYSGQQDPAQTAAVLSAILGRKKYDDQRMAEQIQQQEREDGEDRSDEKVGEKDKSESRSSSSSSKNVSEGSSEKPAEVEEESPQVAAETQGVQGGPSQDRVNHAASGGIPPQFEGRPSQYQVVNGNSLELIQGMANEDLARIPLDVPQFMMSSQQQIQYTDIGNLVNDQLKQFYSYHQTIGYKYCTCNSCQRLCYPILIKANRNPQEFDELHRSYFIMVSTQQQRGPTAQAAQQDDTETAQLQQRTLPFPYGLQPASSSVPAHHQAHFQNPHEKFQNIKLLFF